MSKKLNTLELYALPTLSTPAGGFVSFGAKTDGLYQKVGTVETKLATINDTVDNSVKLNNQLPSYYLDYSNLTNKPTSSLSSNYLPKWNGSSLVNSLLYDTGTGIYIGGLSSSHTATKLNVLGGLWVGDYNVPQTLSLEGNIELKVFNSTLAGIKENHQDTTNGGVTLQYRNNSVSTLLQNGLTLNYLGNVGIGTSTPNASYKLDVIGTINASTSIKSPKFELGNGWDLRAVGSELQIFYNGVKKGAFTDTGFTSTGEITAYTT